MGKKYFAWSFDDGLEQDKKIIKVLKQYGMGATFNLNSGMYGEKTYEGRIGNLGLIEKPAETFDPSKKHLLPYVEHFRIPEEELKEVYKGFEIASHTKNHVDLNKCTEEERMDQIKGDVDALSEFFGQKVTGFAFPYGRGGENCRKALEAAGIRHARTVSTAKDFRFPEDPLMMPMTGWHISKKIFEKLDDFFKADCSNEDLFFLMFAHGYEFDFGTKESNWEKFERICRTVSSRNDVICTSVGEAFRLHEEG